MFFQKRGQIYVITAIIICIAFFMVIATYRTRSSLEDDASGYEVIARELPIALNGISGSFTEDDFSRIDDHFATYFEERGITYYAIYFVTTADDLYLYNGFSQSSLLACGSEQTEVGTHSLQQFSKDTFFRTQSNGTALLVSERQCDLSLFSDTERMEGVSYTFAFERDSLSGYSGLLWFETDGDVEIERFSS